MKTGPKPTPVLARITARSTLQPSGCIEWNGYRTELGYGRIGVGSLTDGTRRNAKVHRVAYELLVGPVPAGLDLDHLCRNPACWNPGHLEPVTRRVNTIRGEGPTAHNARKTHCQRGHEFDDANTRVDRHGRRACRTCDRDDHRAQAMRPPQRP